MATSGTSSFDLNLTEIFEEAYDRCGLVIRSGADYRSARRSFDLLMIEWANKGTNFWTLEEASSSVAAGTGTITLDADVLDVIEMYTRKSTGLTTQQDTPITRISVSEYDDTSQKLQRGRPTNFWLDKQRDAPVVRLWPVPDETTTVVYRQLVRIQDAGSPGTNTADVPWRFLPALVAGIAWKVAEKKAPQRKQELEATYLLAWDDAISADRDRSSLKFMPNLHPYMR